jgi:hypothetical protein
MLNPKIPEVFTRALRRDYAIMKGEELRFEIEDEDDSQLSVNLRFAIERDNVFEVINANTFTMYA